MSLDRPPISPPPPLWTSLIQYYRACLSREQNWGVRVPAAPGAYVTLAQIDEHLVTRKAATTILSEPQHTQPVLAYLNRRGRGIGGTFIYGYPLVRQGGGLVPLCYTEVGLEPGSAPQTIVLTRGNADLLINRHLLLEAAGLTDEEVNDLLRALLSPKSKGPAALLDQYLLEIDLFYDAVLFATEAIPSVRGPGRELQLMEQLRKERLPDTIRFFIGEQGIPASKPASEALTILPADPVQEGALRRRSAPFLVVTGPAGAGKTQTAINLMVGALAAGQRVLYISPDEAAADTAFDALAREALFPGVLQIGGRPTRAASLAHARQVVRSVREAQEQITTPMEWARESRRLGEEVARFDSEAEEILRLDALLAELTEQNRQVEESIQAHPQRSWMLALADRITPEAAVQFRPEQLDGLHQLVAQATGWGAESGSLGGRLKERMRSGQFKSGLKQLGIPEFCLPDGDLPALVSGLTLLEQAFPLLLVRAGLLHTRSEHGRFRARAVILADLAERIEAKVAVDRKRLQAAWLGVADRMRPKCDQLEAIIEQEEKALAAPPTQRGAARRSRFSELMDAFPAVISQTFAVAGAIPNEPELFDLLIVDDASAVDIPSFLPVLYRAKRVCILGDEHGAKHQTSLGEEEDSRLLGRVEGRNLAAFAYVAVSVLDRALQVMGPERVVRLRRQYRAHRAISDWCSEQFYDGEVRSHRLEPADVADAGFRFADVAEGTTIYPAPEAVSQAQNPLEARQAARLITQYIARGITDLAVLTPFRGQALLMETLLTRLSEVEPDPARAAALRRVVVATPQTLGFGRYQSVVISLVAARGATPETLRWLEKQRVSLNQMISGASDLVTVVGHRATLRSGGPTLASLAAHADRRRLARGTESGASRGRRE